jgi:hypothetical protein
MPSIGLRAELLQDLEDHYRQVLHQRFQRRLAELLSDLSDSSDSESISSDSERSNSPSDVSDMSIVSPDSPDDVDMASQSSSSGSNTSSDSSLSSDLEEEFFALYRRRYCHLIREIERTRVLYPAPSVPKMSQLPLLDHFREYSPARWRRKLRVEPSTFDTLLGLIQLDPVFHNNSNHPQLPVEMQLAVFLFRAGHHGNGASPEDTAAWSGLSVGGVDKCTDRVLVALLELHDRAVSLPEGPEKEAAKEWVEAQSCPEWRDGFLVVDGSKIPFFQRPGLHGDAWFDKDKQYSMDLQVTTRVFDEFISGSKNNR